MPLFGGPPNIKKMEAKRDVKGLIKALSYEKDADVRRDAVIALGKVGDAQAVDPLLSTLGYTWGDKNTMEALIEIGSTAVEPLSAALKHSNSFRQAQVVEILGKIGDPRAVEPLCAVLKNSDEKVTRSAAWVLGELGDARAVEPLIIAFEDPRVYVRKDVAHALGKLGDARAAEPLIAALKDSDVQSDAVEALGMLGDIRALEPLLTILGGAKGNLRETAVIALEKISTAGAVPDNIKVSMLISKLQFHDPVEVAKAAAALGQLGDLRAIEPLESIAMQGMYTQRNYNVGTVAAVEALGQLAAMAPSVIDTLISYLRSSHHSIRKAAAKALVKLYFSDGLGEMAKQKLLGHRDEIIAGHNDRFSTCRYEGHGDHSDQGIGVEFPL